MDRIQAISDREQPFLPSYRPPYQYQVPLEFIPGLGRSKLGQLLQAFGTEMNILHRVSFEELSEVIGAEIAGYITQARIGQLTLEVGGGGHYGRVKVKD